MVKTLLYKICFIAFATFIVQPIELANNKELLELPHLKIETKKNKEVPVLNINVYIMGRDEMSKEVSLAIGDNIDFLNQEFDDQIQFHFDGLFLDPVQAYLPDLYDKFFEANSDNLDPLFKPFEHQGGINVYVFDTYVREGEEAALTGFTPRLKSGQDSYSLNSPTFDRVFISYDGLLDKSTLAHEIGHFLGLYHPWELNDSEKDENGLFTKEDENENHMSYSSEVHEFTSEQLEMMRISALKYRTYLCKKIRHIKTRA